MSHIDDVRLAKGFIMHKMYRLGYTTGKHTSTDHLPKSCPAELRPFVEEAVRDLISERLLSKKPTGYGPQVTALKSPTGFGYANSYRRRYGIKEEEYGKPVKSKKVEPLTKEELHKLKIRK
ncbi:MAG: hypothetical protein WB661_06095 [Candidatus Bathyarchaeia archaeon]